MTDDATVLAIVEALQMQLLTIEALKRDTDSRLDKRALSIAATELETAMLWIANARRD
jgi:hypothetical protein